MKKVFTIFITPIVCLAFLFFAVSYFVLPCWFPPFYYAEFNAVKKNFEAIEGVEILDSWQHHDISLEDCGFKVSYRSQEPVQIDFYENDDWNDPFELVDGFTISAYRNRATGKYDEIIHVSSKSLKKKGVSVSNLSEFLENQDRIVNFALSYNIETLPSKDENWVRVFTDLDAYKNSLPNTGPHTTSLPRFESTF